MSNNANNTAITPKEYTFNTIKSKDKLTIAKVMKRYYQHVNFYKKNAQLPIPEKSVVNQVALAEQILGAKAEDK